MDETSPCFPYLFAFPFIWISGLIAFGIWRRRNAGKPIFARRPPKATFFETWASGRNLRTWCTRLGGANRCLVVTVIDGRLQVEPGFPINIMLPLDLYGLTVDVRLSDIRSVESRSAFLVGEKVIIHWKGDQGRELVVKDADGLMAALRKA